ncbi:MAG: lipoyl(octanoyl) transferase LipB [Planctomycetota bacterium]
MTEDPRPRLEVLRLGRTPWQAAYELQQARLAARLRGDVPDALFLCEHDPVITLGRRSPSDDAAGAPFPIIAIERGGEATYHGPGQLVAYPVLELPEGRRDLHRYLRDLEQVGIETLAAFGVAGQRREGYTGVWIGDLKVASIGVAVRRWVTWHGLALNVTTDLDAFRTFQPCGLDASVMTRLADHAAAVSVAEVAPRFEAAFRAQFGFAPRDSRL